MSNTYEHILAFPSEAAAQADPVVGKWWREGDKDEPGSWDMSSCIPNLKCWDEREDKTAVVKSKDGDFETTTHTYQPGWWICIGLAEINKDLRDHANLRMLNDRYARETEKRAHVAWRLKASAKADDAVHLKVSP